MEMVEQPIPTDLNFMHSHIATQLRAEILETTSTPKIDVTRILCDLYTTILQVNATTRCVSQGQSSIFTVLEEMLEDYDVCNCHSEVVLYNNRAQVHLYVSAYSKCTLYQWWKCSPFAACYQVVKVPSLFFN